MSLFKWVKYEDPDENDLSLTFNDTTLGWIHESWDWDTNAPKYEITRIKDAGHFPEFTGPYKTLAAAKKALKKQATDWLAELRELLNADAA